MAMVSSGAKSFVGPLLLYAASVGLTGFASLQVVAVLPLHRPESREVAARRGVVVAHERLTAGRRRASGLKGDDWLYSNTTRSWWEGFADTNWLGTRTSHSGAGGRSGGP
ncbi:MAG: hypothetical protein NXI31_21310 [bacterium]|nr:hypothetical protein [bacterium]